MHLSDREVQASSIAGGIPTASESQPEHSTSAESETGGEQFSTEAPTDAVPENTTQAPTSEPEIILSGACGDQLNWTLDDRGTLRVFGEGRLEMPQTAYPWLFIRQPIDHLVIENGVTGIGFQAFRCGATSLSIPESVVEISETAFNSCNQLTDITVHPDNPVFDSRNDCNAIIRTGDNCLIAGCQATVIPDTVTSIGMLAFAGCQSLTDIAIPSSVTEIGELAFEGCKGLTVIKIPESVTSIHAKAFNTCPNLVQFEVDPANPVYDSRNGCNAIIRTSDNCLIAGCQTTVIPEGITCIGKYAFYDCWDMTGILLPESLTSIEEYGFYYCSGMPSITIPEGVTSIGQNAFSFCPLLTISCVEGSYAETWAKASGIPVRLIEKPSE